MSSTSPNKKYANSGRGNTAGVAHASNENKNGGKNKKTKREKTVAIEPTLAWRMGVLAVIAITVLCFDRISKSMLLAAVAQGFKKATFIPGLVDITYVENYGAAFGIAQGYAWGFVVIAALVIATSIAYLVRAPYVAKAEVVGLALVMGGAVGNAIDRIMHGFVVDFIATIFIDFPVFNIADIGICVGVFLAFVGFAFFSPAYKHQHEDDDFVPLKQQKSQAKQGKKNHK